jgi:RNA polymerase sigma factor (sigma-70 family)
MTKEDFAAQISKMTKVLKPFALRLTKDRDDANDLLQDTLVKGYVNREKFTEGTNLKAWLYTIMKNTFNTNYQKMLRQSTFTDSSDDLYYLNSVDSSTHNLGLGGLIQQDINKALNRLEHSYLSPFMLYFSGWKYHEIAQQLDIPIGTVKNRIHIARKELKGMLKMYA